MDCITYADGWNTRQEEINRDRKYEINKRRLTVGEGSCRQVVYAPKVHYKISIQNMS